MQRCWKGLHEVAVPVHRGGLHVLTLFAGPWRAPAGTRDPEVFPPIAKLYAALPPLDSPRVAAIGRTLHLLGEALLARLDRGHDNEPASRRAAILAFFRYHDAQADGLADLAAHLGLSRSRTSRLVQATLGRPFSAVQQATRIARAKSLLLATALSAAEVAERTGFADPYHFNRVFRRLVGTTPGRFRRDPTAAYSTGPVPVLPEPER